MLCGLLKKKKKKQKTLARDICGTIKPENLWLKTECVTPFRLAVICSPFGTNEKSN